MGLSVSGLARQTRRPRRHHVQSFQASDAGRARPLAQHRKSCQGAGRHGRLVLMQFHRCWYGGARALPHASPGRGGLHAGGAVLHPARAVNRAGAGGRGGVLRRRRLSRWAAVGTRSGFPRSPIPNAYALEISGDSMDAGVSRRGSSSSSRRARPLRRGDRVVVRTRSRRGDGQGTGAAVGAAGGSSQPEPGPSGLLFRVKLELAWMHRVVWVKPVGSPRGGFSRAPAPVRTALAKQSPRCRSISSGLRRYRAGASSTWSPAVAVHRARPSA